MLTTIQAEQSDVEKLQSIAKRDRKPIEQVLHEMIVEAEYQRAIREDELDPDEKAFNDAARSPEVRQEILKLNQTLRRKNIL